MNQGDLVKQTIEMDRHPSVGCYQRVVDGLAAGRSSRDPFAVSVDIAPLFASAQSVSISGVEEGQ